MSILKTKFDSASIKSKFTDLLESLDRNNTSKFIVENYYGKISSLEVSEGLSNPKNVYEDLKAKGFDEMRAKTSAVSHSLSEAKTQIADSFVLNRISILESAVKDLGVYSWVPKVKEFIEESTKLVNENRTYILIESIIRDLELDRNSKSYQKAISALREASESETPDFAVVDLLESETWIPLVKRLYEYCSSKKGSLTGKNPNFEIERVYSPVVAVDENTFVFHSTGKLIEYSSEGTLTESKSSVDDSFMALVSITESCKVSENKIRLYPNQNTVLDVNFANETSVSLNGKLIESSTVESHLLSSGAVKYTEREKLANIGRVIAEGNKIKEIDFGYRIKSNLYEGLSATVFTVNDQIYIQKVNKGMKENSLTLAESATDAVDIVKSFINYDISESIKSLLEGEKSEIERKNIEISKIESRIKFLIEKLAEVETVEKQIGKNESIIKAKTLLESQIKEQNQFLSKLKGFVSESTSTYDPKTSPVAPKTELSGKLTSREELHPGKEYSIRGLAGYIFQGEADGYFIFNQKDETSPTPLHMKESEVEIAIANGEIAK